MRPTPAWLYIRSEDGGIEPDLQYEEVLKRLADKYVAEGEREKVKAELRLDAVIKRLIRDGKLKNWYITERYNGISPALVLVFNDFKAPGYADTRIPLAGISAASAAARGLSRTGLILSRFRRLLRS